MTNFTTALGFLMLSCLASMATGFQTGQMLPMRIDPIPIHDTIQRLGLKRAEDATNRLSIGSRPDMGYKLVNEHEVVCPVTGSHQGVLCTAVLPHAVDERDDAEAIANNHELVSQAILSGSLAASVRNACPGRNSVYYLPFIVTLVESLMADEMESVDFNGMVFNSGGLETNEILVDWNDNELSREEMSRSVMLYACNTQADATSATSDVYLLPPPGKRGTGKVWRFTVDYKVATINLQQIKSFGDRDSSTPLRPDVWLKDDYY